VEHLFDFPVILLASEKKSENFLTGKIPAAGHFLLVFTSQQAAERFCSERGIQDPFPSRNEA
jgi:hypothetical protein